MSDGSAWGWSALFFLGAYHGINPAMGWLFAVARGMQEKTARAVAVSLAPIALGHAAAIGAVLLLARLVEIVLPLTAIRWAVAGALVALGIYKIVRNRHFAWGGMRVGFRDLTIWSFLMASAHGAGLMVLPVVMAGVSAAGHHAHAINLQDPLTGVWATLIHTLGYLAVTAAVALVVYQKLGLALLRTAWFNLDRVWAGALIGTGVLTLVM
jgi:hypothetical protein